MDLGCLHLKQHEKEELQVFGFEEKVKCQIYGCAHTLDWRDGLPGIKRSRKWPHQVERKCTESRQFCQFACLIGNLSRLVGRTHGWTRQFRLEEWARNIKTKGNTSLWSNLWARVFTILQENAVKNHSYVQLVVTEWSVMKQNKSRNLEAKRRLVATLCCGGEKPGKWTAVMMANLFLLWLREDVSLVLMALNILKTAGGDTFMGKLYCIKNHVSIKFKEQ